MPDGSAPAVRRRLAPAARGAEILDAAFAEFAEHGYAAARVSGVARRAGVAKGLVYHYHPSKEALFRAVMQASLEGAFRRAEDAVAAAGMPAPEIMSRLLALALREGGDGRGRVLFRLVLAESGRFPELGAWWRAAVHDRALAIVRAVLAHGAARGEFDAELAARPGVAEAVLAPAVAGDAWALALGGAAPDRAVLLEAHLALVARALAP